MKIKHLRIGIVGAGAMLKYHTAGFRSAGGEVVALMAAHRESAESAARAFGIPRVCDSLDEMLALPDLDAISIIAPNRFHAPMTLAALKAGKHVFCEKPPAINARDAAKMAAAAARAGRLLMFNFCNRARPESIALKRAIDAGTVGHINSAQAWWIRRAGIPGYGGELRPSRPGEGTASLASRGGRGVDAYRRRALQVGPYRTSHSCSGAIDQKGAKCYNPPQKGEMT